MGLVELSVSDLDRSVAYWQQAVGLRVLSHENGTAELGTDMPLVRLVDEPGAQSSRGFTGLFHVALLVRDRTSLGSFFAHTVRDQIEPTGLSDHVVSESVYLRDPDYHGIEIYVDRPREQWEGRVSETMTTIPLDTDSLLAESGDAEFDGLPDGTTVGHVHLCVSDVDEMIGFYRDKLGMGLTAHRSDMAAFLSAGGYHHHLGGNTWETRGAEPAPEGTTRLLRFTIVVPDDKELERVAGRIGGREVKDPSGNSVVLATP